MTPCPALPSPASLLSATLVVLTNACLCPPSAVAEPRIEGRVGSRAVNSRVVTSSRSLVDETRDFASAVKHASAFVADNGADRVLLVVDIDNTLLAMNSALGSDQWFEWQSYLQQHEPDSDELIAKDFAGLLKAQGKLFALGSMHPPQENLPALVEKVQAMSVRTLVLTSRGPEFRSYTERELAANGYRFAHTALPVERAPRGSFMPYNHERIAESGLTDDEATRFHLGAPRPVSYANGVFMTSGQHKGAMLLVLLEQAEAEFDAVVFVDDHGRHVTRVYDALAGRGVSVAAVHYKREDAAVNRFRYGDKTKVTKQWQKLDKAVESVFE